MKTPMQELLEWVRATLPMDLDTPRLIEEKIESMLEKEMTLLRSECDWCNGNNSPHMPQDTDGCSNDRSKCSCKNWGGCPVD